MAFNLTQTLINSHLVSGNMQPGNEIALRIDQALLQDVLGTLVMLELEAMGVDRVRIDPATQYIDHNLLETDNLNGDELHAGDTIRIANVEAALTAGNEIIATIDGSDDSITLHHNLSQRQIKTLMAGGAINWHDNREPGRVASNPAQPAAPAAEVQPRKQGGDQ